MECPSCHAQVEPGKFCPSCGATLPVVTGGVPAAEEADVSLVGKTLGSKYKVVKLLGEGGMGAVYQGEQQLGTNVRKVAIKTLHQHLSKDPKILARFDREVGTVAELEHPNTIQVYDYGKTDDGILYIVMEFILGASLADAIEKGGAMDPARVEKIMSQVCGSLEEAHGRGIVHRDLKPDNIVLTERAGQKDFVKVLDFGIAKRSNEEDKNEQKLTQQGMVLGTPPYMSPEQFTGKPIDARSDIYSLAIMAFEMLTGELPFRANTAWEWATQHMTSAPRDFESTPVSGRVPQRMKDAIKRGLAKNPDDRFVDVRAFFDAFSNGAAAVPSPNAPPQQPAMGAAPVMAQATPGKGKTEIGTPLDFGAAGAAPSYGSNPGPMTPLAGAGTPALGNVAFPTPSAGVPQGPAHTGKQSGGGGNKGMLLAAAGVVAVISIGAIVFGLKGSSGSSGGGNVDLNALAAEAGAAPGPVELIVGDAAAPPASDVPVPGEPATPPLTQPSTPHAPVAHHDAGAGHPGAAPGTGGGASSGGAPTTPPAGLPTALPKPPAGSEPLECLKARVMRAAGNIAAYQTLAKQCEAKGGHV